MEELNITPITAERIWVWTDSEPSVLVYYTVGGKWLARFSAGCTAQVICNQERWVVNARWLDYLGKLSHHSESRPWWHSEGDTQISSRKDSEEEASNYVCLVAWIGSWYWTKIEGCHQCQNCRPNPLLALLKPWKWSSQPWSRVHIDFAGPFKDQMLFIVTDEHFKWLQINPVCTITAQATIQHVTTIFAQFALPKRVELDNGPTFISLEFKNFCIRMWLSMWGLLRTNQLLMGWWEEQ